METYSAPMAAAVRRELSQADGPRFAQLLAYYHRRGGPGLALAKEEQLARQQRPQSTQLPQAA